MKRLAVAVALTALLTAPAASARATYPALNEAASWLAQRPAEVRCLTMQESALDTNIAFWGASAYVDFAADGGPSDYTVFSYGLCENLVALNSGTWRGRYSLSGLAWAVLVLTHESGHLRGWGWWQSEAKVNCWALRHVRYAALHLGASPDLAWAIRSWAFYWYRQQPPEYRLRGCQIPYP